MTRNLSIRFGHGLGDCCHMAALLQLYRRRGYSISVDYEDNKAPLWQAAGIAKASPGASDSDSPWTYPGGFNVPIPCWDGQGNRIYLCIPMLPLPSLGGRDAVWDELCKVDMEGVFDSLITDAMRDDARRFLEHLPRPILLLHTNGSNFSGQKNIPEVPELYRCLLDETDAGIVLLDWDERVPLLPHGRVRHLRRDWGHISLVQMAALYDEAALLVGIDSGPYHFGHFTRTPSLGVFHNFYPACVTLPRPSGKSAVLTRNGPAYKPVNIARRQRWRVLEYAREMPTPAEITRHAARMLAGPRYGVPIGDDVMLQQWVRDWMKGSTAVSPISDRAPTMDCLLQEAARRFRKPRIVETGCIREAENWGGAGNSTYLLAAWAAMRGGSFVSVDNNERHAAFAREQVAEWGGAKIVCADSVRWLESEPFPIDILYLDSMDTESPHHAEHGLAEIQAAMPRLHASSLVVYDDTVWDRGWVGKGRLGVPWLIGQGWKVLASGYQVVLGRESASARSSASVMSEAVSISPCPREKLEVLARLVRERRRIPGDLAEVGCFRGGSALVMNDADPAKTLHLFDTFAGLPHDCPIGVHRRGEFAANLTEVKVRMWGRKVEIHPGLFPETTAGLEEARYSVVHLDADLYDSTRDALAYFWPRMSPGGCILLDDVDWSHTPGVTLALKEANLYDRLQRLTPNQGVLVCER